MKNLSSYCRLIDAKIRASDKDLPVLHYLTIFGMGWDGGRNIDHNLTLFSTRWEINLDTLKKSAWIPEKTGGFVEGKS